MALYESILRICTLSTRNCNFYRLDNTNNMLDTQKAECLYYLLIIIPNELQVHLVLDIVLNIVN